MTNKYSILSEKESFLLEKLIAKYGLLVNFDQIRKELANDYSRQQVRNLAVKMSKNGWLVRIKKGVYHIANLESRGFTNISIFVIAQNLVKESYVSFELALQYHSMFDQYLKMVMSVCIKKHTPKEIQGIIYRFVKTQKNNFYGWREEQIEGQRVKIATPEKAILDMLRFHRTIYSLDIVLEKLREYRNSFDAKKFQEFSKSQSITVQRILGFLFDKADFDSDPILQLVKDIKGASIMTKDSKRFSAKWSLYYSSHFE